MNEAKRVLTGGCLCGAVRYEASGEPLFSGFCYCEDCRRASGAGAVPYMGFPKDSFRVRGVTKQARKRLLRGGEAVRNFCPECGSLMFGGEYGLSEQHTVYAGTLDDPFRLSSDPRHHGRRTAALGRCPRRPEIARRDAEGLIRRMSAL
jgi:hypothetical protein